MTKYRYFTSWLRIREPWYVIIVKEYSQQSSIALQLWRDYLTSIPTQLPITDTQSFRRKELVLQIIQSACRKENLDLYRCTMPEWLKQRFITLDQNICREILWEAYEMGFRIELQQLDHQLCPVVVPMEMKWAAHEARRRRLLAAVWSHGYQLPLNERLTDIRGLAAPILSDRLGALEAFRCIVNRWPEVPAELIERPFTPEESTTLALQRERTLIMYYLQMAYNCFGRPALIPHMFPQS